MIKNCSLFLVLHAGHRSSLCQEMLKFETIVSKFKGLSQEPLHQY